MLRVKQKQVLQIMMNENKPPDQKRQKILKLLEPS